MAYIVITDAMVGAAANELARRSRTTTPAVHTRADIRAALEAAMKAAQISMDTAPAPTHVRVWFNGDEAVRCQVDGPAVDYVADVKTVQVARR